MAAVIVFALRQADSGKVSLEVCCKKGISEASVAADYFYNWKKKYSGLGVSVLRRLCQLEYKNQQLRQLVADLISNKQRL
ncbi:transposase [Fibrella sp. HMF5036]|uniref:Transposase n=1 Tax=Fibrella aquatilis TaxID=2817059 RepID=A0A939K0J0_9BACT|nr:transposase [Fibrella aquatilis]